MSKQLIQDMVRVPKKEQVSKKIWYPDNKKPVEPPKEENNFKDDRNKEEYTYQDDNSGRVGDTSGSSRYRLWFVAGISILFLLFSFSFLFSGATIKVTPRSEELFLNENFSAVKDGTEEDLPFELVVMSGEEAKNIQGGDEIDVKDVAEGSVVIYNAFSATTQRLDIDTRLEGSNGKIYKTKKAITVPGMKDKTPGSVEVEIYGSESGEEYNSTPLDFKIFGFKGTQKYAKFYARSKGEIAGGFVGKKRQIGEADKTKALTELKTSLEAKLLRKATDQIPSGFVLFNNAAFLTVDEENFNSSGESNIVPISIKGTLFGVLFNEKALTKKIIERSFPGEEKNEVVIQNIRDLVFSISNQTAAPYQRNILENITTVNFNLSGTSKAVWQVDKEKLIDGVLGKRKSDFNQLMSEFPNILAVNLSLRPFWKRSLPEEREDIKLQVINSI